MGIYDSAAHIYFMAGFSPLPAIGKLLAVKEASGHHPIAAIDRIEKWTRTHGPFNIALRLPQNVIGLDIDSYKGDLEKLAKLEDKLGPLPKTWNSDSRGGNGGKLLFRIPNRNSKWISNIDGITIVQHTHRYIMAYPSINKESNSRYRWYFGLGGELMEDVIPSIEDLAELPEKWIEALLKSEEIPVRSAVVGIDNNDLDVFNTDDPCEYMNWVIDECATRLIASYDGGLHDTGISVLGVLARVASEGHSGMQVAWSKLTHIFCAGGRARDLAAEWESMWDFVAAQIDVSKISELDPCQTTLNFVVTNKMEQDIRQLFNSGFTTRQVNRILFRKKGDK